MGPSSETLHPYFEDRSESYVDGLGLSIPSVTTRFGQVKAGPQITRVFQTSDVIVEPPFAANLIWNFAAEASGGGLAGGCHVCPLDLKAAADLAVVRLASAEFGDVIFALSYDWTLAGPLARLLSIAQANGHKH